LGIRSETEALEQPFLLSPPEENTLAGMLTQLVVLGTVIPGDLVAPLRVLARAMIWRQRHERHMRLKRVAHRIRTNIVVKSGQKDMDSTLKSSDNALTAASASALASELPA